MKKFLSYQLDEINHCLWHTGENSTRREVDLTPKTFDVLRYLVRHAGHLITHDELLEALWGNIQVQPEIFKGHIRAIRRALGDNAQSPMFIETLRGRGYRFIAPIVDQNPSDSTILSMPLHGGLVGRESELERLTQLMRCAASGTPQLLFIVGEAGIGKSALLDRFLSDAGHSTETFVSRANCFGGYGESEPYYPILDALSRLCRGHKGDFVLQTLIDVAPTWAAQLPTQISAERRSLLQQQIVGAGIKRMLYEICVFLEVLAQEQLVLLVIEDVHWADYSTLDLLSAIMQRRTTCKLMIIATYRPEGDDRGSLPVKQINGELLLRSMCSEFILPPLSEDVVGFLLSGSEYGDPTSREFAHFVTSHCGGNPLFMRAILDHLVDCGLVYKNLQGWEPNGPISNFKIELPRTVTQVIEMNIQRLDREQQRMLEAASVAGINFDTVTTAAAAGLAPERFEELCGALVRRQAFVAYSDDRISPDDNVNQYYKFNHALYRRAFYDRQGPIRKTQLHRRIAEIIELTFSPEQRAPIALELGEHCAAAGEWSQALDYLHIALQTAKRRQAYREAIAIIDLATELISNLSPDNRPKKNIEFLEERAALYASARIPLAHATFEQLERDAEQLDDADIQARALLGLAFAASWQDQAQTLRTLDKALKVSARQANLQSRATTRISVFVRRIWTMGWNEEDVRLCEAALLELRRGGPPLSAAWGCMQYSMICLISSRYREAKDTLRENFLLLSNSPEVRSEFDVARGMWMDRIGVTWSWLYLGEIGKSLDEFDAGIAILNRNGNYSAARTLSLFRIVLLLHCMDFEAVIEECDRLLSTQSSPGSGNGANDASALPTEQRVCHILAGVAHVELGNIVMAAKLLHDAERQMDSQPISFDWYWRLTLEWGFVNLAIRLRDVQTGLERAQRFIDAACATAERTWQAIAWESMARVLLQTGNTDGALDCIGMAIKASEGYETPLADWRIHRTAALAYEMRRDHVSALKHERLSMETRMRLASSLPREHRLRRATEGLER